MSKTIDDVQEALDGATQAVETRFARDAATIRKLRAALQEIVHEWKPRHHAAMERWEGCGTEAFKDQEYNEATAIKSMVDLVRKALEEMAD